MKITILYQSFEEDWSDALLLCHGQPRRDGAGLAALQGIRRVVAWPSYVILQPHLEDEHVWVWHGMAWYGYPTRLKMYTTRQKYG